MIEERTPSPGIMNFLPYLSLVLLLLSGSAVAQSTPRIKSDPQFDRDLAVASYVYALDLMVGLTTVQADKIVQRIRPDCEPDRWQLFYVSGVCRGDQLMDQGLWMHDGLEDILTPDQKHYFQIYNEWRFRNRIKNFNLKIYTENIEAQIRCVEESKVHLLEQELGLSEKKVDQLRVLSRKKISDAVKTQVTERERGDQFRLALENIPAGNSLLDAFEPGGALEMFKVEDLKDFLTLDKLSNQHPAVAVRPDQPDWDRLVGKILNEDEMKKLNKFRKERTNRQAQYIAHVFVADWTADMNLEYQQRVALMELIANNLTPTFWPSLYISRVENKPGLKAVPREKYVAVVGEENLAPLMQKINSTEQFW